MSAQLEGLAYGYSLAYPRDRAAYEAERAEKSAQQWLEAAVWAEGQL